ncbi:MAG: hypothetical protein V1729_01185 [Candidatus Woesearchaeota archaeon]
MIGPREFNGDDILHLTKQARTLEEDIRYVEVDLQNMCQDITDIARHSHDRFTDILRMEQLDELVKIEFEKVPSSEYSQELTYSDLAWFFKGHANGRNIVQEIGLKDREIIREMQDSYKIAMTPLKKALAGAVLEQSKLYAGIIDLTMVEPAFPQSELCDSAHIYIAEHENESLLHCIVEGGRYTSLVTTGIGKTKTAYPKAKETLRKDADGMNVYLVRNPSTLVTADMMAKHVALHLPYEHMREMIYSRNGGKSRLHVIAQSSQQTFAAADDVPPEVVARLLKDIDKGTMH